MNIKKINIYLLAICLFSLVFSLNSCQDKWDEPEFNIPKYDGPAANKTIQDIIDIYNEKGEMDSICHNGETFIVKAVVVSSDEGGNFYKSMVVQDETAAIQIQINKTGLYNFYPVGQTVYIDCKGLVVGNYHGVYQIGWIYQGSIGRIDGSFLDNYLHKDGIPMKDISSMITEINSPEDLNESNINKLVTIKNCQFAENAIGQVWASSDYTTNRSITYINGNQIPDATPLVVRTSNYAKFINYTVPGGYGDLTGILSIYQSGSTSTYQLMLRTKDDIGEFGIVQDVYPMSFDANSFNNGWSSLNNDGDNSSQWSIATYQNFKFMNHGAMENTCDDWLVSPEIPIATVNGSTLYIEHFNTLTGSTPDSYKVYYCTNFNGSINENDWHELSITNYPSEFGYSNGILINNINANFRLAFRYHNDGGNTTQWGIKSLKFSKLIQE